jgi:DNA polymerase elongation subunit (family B)
MLSILATANNSEEFLQKIPQIFGVIKKCRQKLIDGEVPVWDLIISKRLSKHPKHYKQQVSQAIAAEQLISEGAEVQAGNSITFLFTSSKNKRYNRRVRAKQLIEQDVKADVRQYLLLLYSSAANLLSFLGYNTKTIFDAVNGNSSSKQKTVLEF